MSLHLSAHRIAALAPSAPPLQPGGSRLGRGPQGNGAGGSEIPPWSCWAELIKLQRRALVQTASLRSLPSARKLHVGKQTYLPWRRRGRDLLTAGSLSAYRFAALAPSARGSRLDDTLHAALDEAQAV